MEKIILFILLTVINIIPVLAQKPGIYKKVSYKVANKAETSYINENIYEIVGIDGNALLFEPYTQRNPFSGKERIRFRISPALNQSIEDYNDSSFHCRWTEYDHYSVAIPYGSRVIDCYKRIKNPPEVNDFINCISGNYNSTANKMLGVWYYEISGIKCYRILSPTRSLLLFIYEHADGRIDTANGILEAVNYGKNKIVAEDGTCYSIGWNGADTMTVTYTVDGKKHHEEWIQSALPTYLTRLFVPNGSN